MIRCERFFVFLWRWHHEILFVLILCAALLLRVDLFKNDTSYVWQSDYNRDYLVAHHIIAYHEFPLTGPDGEFGSAGNSPAYFYFLARPLLIKDDIVFLGLFNVILQMGALVIVYLLARSMFGKSVGLTAAALFGFTQSIIGQSNFIWQPHIMQPFLLLSFLLLYLAYTRRNYRLIISSVCIFLFAATLHQSVYALAPVYLFSVFLAVRIQQRSLAYYVGAITTFVSTFIVLHLPLFFYFWRAPNSLPSFSNSSHSFLTVNLGQIASNVSARMNIFFDFFFATDSSVFLFPLLLLCFFAILSIAYPRYARQNKEQKDFMLILLIIMMQFFAVTMLVSVSPLVAFPFWYFTPVFGITVIYLAEIITGFFPKGVRYLLIEIPIVVLLIFTFSPNIIHDFAHVIRNVTTDPIGSFSSVYVRPPFVGAMEKEIYGIQKREHREDFLFFGIQTFRYGLVDSFSNEILWTPLERDLRVPLVALSDGAQRDYKPIGNPLYLFLNCRETSDAEHECLIPFSLQFPQYEIEKKVYEYPSIYLARRESP